MKKKMSDTKKALIVLLIIILVCAISFVGAKYFDDKAKNQDYDYQTVKCIVSDVRITHGKYSSTQIYVEYNGKEYRLQSPGGSYRYIVGKNIDAYLYNDKIYADAEDIRHDSKDGKIAGVFIIIRFITGILVITYPILMLVSIVKKRKLDKQKAESGIKH